MVNANIADKANVADTTNLMLWTGILKDGVVGLEVDYRNGTFKRLSSADGLSQGADFDSLSMYGGRRCCNVADDGTINAWYGDESYTEDGSNGQVMVYQPKFYYMVYPVETEPIDTGIGYHLRKANYYVSEKPRPGFRLHPAFYDAEGNEITADAYESAAETRYEELKEKEAKFKWINTKEHAIGSDVPMEQLLELVSEANAGFSLRDPE